MIGRGGAWARFGGRGAGSAGCGVDLAKFERVTCSDFAKMILRPAEFRFVLARLSLGFTVFASAPAGLVWSGILNIYSIT